MFEEAFEGLLNEIEHVDIEFDKSPDFGFILKTLNGCNNPDDYRDKLFLKHKQGIKTIKASVQKLPQNERIPFLEYVKIKLMEIEKIPNK